MPITRITANGTFQLKTMAGYIRALSVPNAGTTWTLTLNDGPDGLGSPTLVNFNGGTLTTSTGVLSPIFFSKGIQVVTAGGAAGELDVDWF